MNEDKKDSPPQPEDRKRVPLSELAHSDAHATRRAQTAPGGEGERKPYVEWGEAHATPAWLVNAARHGRGWPLGKEVTEDEFNQAVHDAANLPIR